MSGGSSRRQVVLGVSAVVILALALVLAFRDTLFTPSAPAPTEAEASLERMMADEYGAELERERAPEPEAEPGSGRMPIGG